MIDKAVPFAMGGGERKGRGSNAFCNGVKESGACICLGGKTGREGSF